MARATSSFPVPVSPDRRTVESLGATLATWPSARRKAADVPTISSNIEVWSISSFRARFSRYSSSFNCLISLKAFSRAVLEKAFKEIRQLKEELYRENLALKEEIDQTSMFEEIVGTSAALRRALGQVARVAPSDSTVLLSGETGTGKELVARAIHRRSRRASKSFVSVNCAAIPP